MIGLAAPPSDLVARAMIRQVHQAIDTYRDDRRDGIVRARNRLVVTSLAFGFATYAMLALAIDRSIETANLVAAATFFLVGAVVGLFAQLRADASADSAGEDYGLAIVRIAQTPLSSGFAAISGVVMLPMLFAYSVDSGLSAVVGSAVQASSSGATAAASTQGVVLTDIFNIKTFPYGLLVAAVFGLSPGLLIDRLAKQAEEYKKDLRTSSSGG